MALARVGELVEFLHGDLFDIIDSVDILSFVAEGAAVSGAVVEVVVSEL
jgi:hypothetical protein